MTKTLPYTLALLTMLVSYASMIAIFESDEKAEELTVNAQKTEALQFRSGTSDDNCEWVALANDNPKLCWEFAGSNYAPPTAFRVNKKNGLNLADESCEIYNQLPSIQSGVASFKGNAVRWVCPVSIGKGS